MAREDESRPLRTQTTSDTFLYLTEKGKLPLPGVLMPKLLSNHGNFIGSLSDVAKYLGAKAEALGVDIYPGFAATEILRGGNGAVEGVATGDMGIGKNGMPTGNFTRGMELRGRYTLFAEGARGSLTKQLAKDHDLYEGEPQKYGIGLKELWRLAPGKHKPGLIQHTFGWPLDNATGGGSFIYHFGEDRASIGFVVHLNYKNPTLSPYDEFQRFKTHPAIAPMLEGGERLVYGARAITEGGWQSVPRLAVPGRGADRLRRRLRERAPHQGLAQCDLVGHAGGRGAGRCARGRSLARRPGDLRRGVARLADRP